MTAPVTKPASPKRLASVDVPRGSFVRELTTPCASGKSPVRIDAWDGSVHGAVALTSSNTTPSAASESSTGDVNRS